MYANYLRCNDTVLNTYKPTYTTPTFETKALHLVTSVCRTVLIAYTAVSYSY